jgi:hypothetical protein
VIHAGRHEVEVVVLFDQGAQAQRDDVLELCEGDTDG